MNFSRLKETQPLPPSPAFTNIWASSMNGIEYGEPVEPSGDDAYSGALEQYLAVSFCEEGVVAAEPNVLSWKELCPALPQYHAAGGYKLPAESFYSEPLGIGIPSVPC
jgi:hypothetical protein